MNDTIAALEKLFLAAVNNKVRHLSVGTFTDVAASLNLKYESGVADLMDMVDNLQDDINSANNKFYEDGLSDCAQSQQDEHEALEYSIINDMFDPQTKIALKKTALHLTGRDPFRTYDDTEEYGRLLMRLSDAAD